MQDCLFEFIQLEAQVGVVDNHLFCRTQLVKLNVFEQSLAPFSAVSLCGARNDVVYIVSGLYFVILNFFHTVS